jgi:hypothetical protein
MLSKLFFVALAFLATPTTQTVTDCGAARGAAFSITKLSLDPPQAVAVDQNVSLTLFYDSPQEITGGTAVKSATLNYIPFTPSTEDLCLSIPCPLTPGSHDGSSWFLFPAGVTGRLVTKVEWKDLAGALLLCIQMTLDASGQETNQTKWVALRGSNRF